MSSFEIVGFDSNSLSVAASDGDLFFCLFDREIKVGMLDNPDESRLRLALEGSLLVGEIGLYSANAASPSPSTGDEKASECGRIEK
jgi:hypothetical protein